MAARSSAVGRLRVDRYFNRLLAGGAFPEAARDIKSFLRCGQFKGVFDGGV
jgi:hypothetical protein